MKKFKIEKLNKSLVPEGLTFEQWLEDASATELVTELMYRNSLTKKEKKNA